MRLLYIFKLLFNFLKETFFSDTECFCKLTWSEFCQYLSLEVLLEVFYGLDCWTAAAPAIKWGFSWGSNSRKCHNLTRGNFHTKIFSTFFQFNSPPYSHTFTLAPHSPHSSQSLELICKWGGSTVRMVRKVNSQNGKEGQQSEW